MNSNKFADNKHLLSLPETVATPHLKVLKRIQSGATTAGYRWIVAGIITVGGRGDRGDNWERLLKALMSLGTAAPATEKRQLPGRPRISNT